MKFLRIVILIPLFVIATTGRSEASFTEEFISMAMSVSANVYTDDSNGSLTEKATIQAINYVGDQISSKGVELLAKYIIDDVGGKKHFGKVLKDEIANKFKEAINKTNGLSKAKGLGKHVIDVAIGIGINVLSDVVTEKVGAATMRGQLAGYVVKQARVAWAARKGFHYAVLESAMIAGEEIGEAVQLYNKVKRATRDDKVAQTINETNDKVIAMVSSYKSAHPDKKEIMEMEIMSIMKNKLVLKDGTPIPGAKRIISRFIDNIKQADQHKHIVARSMIQKIQDQPYIADAHRDKVKKFVKENFYTDPNIYTEAQGLLIAADTRFKEIAKQNTKRLSELYSKAQQMQNLSPAEREEAIALARGIDSSLNRLSDNDTISYIINSIHKWRSEFSVGYDLKDDGDPIEDAEPEEDPNTDEQPKEQGPDTFEQPKEEGPDTDDLKDDEIEDVIEDANINKQKQEADILFAENKRRGESYKDLYTQLKNDPENQDLKNRVEEADKLLVQSTINYIAKRNEIRSSTGNSSYGQLAYSRNNIRNRIDADFLFAENKRRGEDYEDLYTQLKNDPKNQDLKNRVEEADKLLVQSTINYIAKRNEIRSSTGDSSYGQLAYSRDSIKNRIDAEFKDAKPKYQTHTRITTNKIGKGVYDADVNDSDEEDDQGNPAYLEIPARLGGGRVTQTETFNSRGYKYVSWGKWTPVTGHINPDYSQGGFWFRTQTTPSSIVKNKTGHASYSGYITGDFVSDKLREDAKGVIRINADFSDQLISGRMRFAHDCSGSDFFSCGIQSKIGSFNEPINDYDGSGFGSHSDTVRINGLGLHADRTNLGVVGLFAGPNANEIAGNAWMQDNGGLYNGVFITKSVPYVPFPSPKDEKEKWQGYIAAKLYGDTLVSIPNVVIDNDSTNAPTSGKDSFTEPQIAPSIDASTVKGDYDYTEWGSWNGSGPTLKLSENVFAGIDQANIVIGRLTDPTEMPSSGTRNFGGASHSSQVAGIGYNGEQIGGTIALDADFGSGNVSGTFGFTANEKPWVDGTISNTPINGSGFSGHGNLNINQGGSGNIQGSFYGNNANEVAGSWDIHGVQNTDTTGANGVFRAKQ
jgi:hypothetical protein